MAVLAEGISVVLRLDVIARLMDDEWARFVAIVPNQTLCCDNELARVGFMDPKDVEAFVRKLESHGFQYRGPTGGAIDLVVVDQQRGPAVACEWVEWGRIAAGVEGESVSACRLKGSEQKQLFTPDGWVFEGSLSQKFGFQPDEGCDRRYRFLRKQGRLDVYLDSETGREVFAGRGQGFPSAD